METTSVPFYIIFEKILKLVSNHVQKSFTKTHRTTYLTFINETHKIFIKDGININEPIDTLNPELEKKINDPKTWHLTAYNILMETLANKPLKTMTQTEYLNYSVKAYNYLIKQPPYRYNYETIINGKAGQTPVAAIVIFYDPSKDTNTFQISIFSTAHKLSYCRSFESENYGDTSRFTLGELKKKGYIPYIRIHADLDYSDLVQKTCPFIKEGCQVIYFNSP